MLEYLYGKRFSSKIAWANRNEGDRLGVGKGTEQIVEGNNPHKGQTFSHMNTLTFLKPSHLSYRPAYEDGTECSDTSAYKIQTPGNYPEESVQHSEHGESLKSRVSGCVLTKCFLSCRQLANFGIGLP